jgi:hypothetical protein
MVYLMPRRCHRRLGIELPLAFSAFARPYGRMSYGKLNTLTWASGSKEDKSKAGDEPAGSTPSARDVALQSSDPIDCPLVVWNLALET